MNINKYGLKFDNERIGQLVKEETYAYDMDSCLLDGPEKVAALIEFVFDASNLPEERLWLIALNGARRVSGIFEVSHGTLTMSLVSSRSVFQRAMLAGAASIIVSHNHPSGILDVSHSDRQVTEQLRQAGDILGIPLDDHIIVGGGDFASAF